MIYTRQQQTHRDLLPAQEQTGTSHQHLNSPVTMVVNVTASLLRCHGHSCNWQYFALFSAFPQGDIQHMMLDVPGGFVVECFTLTCSSRLRMNTCTHTQKANGIRANTLLHVSGSYLDEPPVSASGCSGAGQQN